MSYFGVAVSKLLTQIKKSSGAERLDLLDKLYQRTANHLKGIAEVPAAHLRGGIFYFFGEFQL